MELKKLITDCLSKTRLMQLATSVHDRPWVCTIHFYSDENLNIYWISTPVRRHSKDIKQNPKVAAAILVHEDTESEKYIVGLSVEGTAAQMSEEEARKVGDKYIEKLGKDPELLKGIREGRNPHKFYRLTPTKIVLFDTKNFPDNPRQELAL